MAPPVTAWISQTHPIADGEQVRAAVTNRPTLEAFQREQHLKDRLDSLQAGQALYLFDVALDPLVQVGQAVYWSAADLEYKQALAKVAFNATLGGYVIAESSYVVGICIAKYTASMGDLLIVGYASGVNFTQAIGAAGNLPADAGAYYLSASQPGHYSKQKPPVGIYVAYLRGDGSAHVNPTPREVLENHIHYCYDLFAQPAGILHCTDSDRIYQFFSSDPGLPGWLPASDPVFGGMAPAGAKFGYNLTMHPELDRVWPPIPVDNVYLEQDGVGVPKNRYSIDVNGIWWYDDCYAKGPWPIVSGGPCVPSSSSLSSSSSSSLSSSSSSPSGSSSSSPSGSSSSAPSGLCDSGPWLEQLGFVRADPTTKTLRLCFTKMVYKTNQTVVTSLRSAPGSPIKVLGCDELTAKTTGDLCLALDLALNVTENEPGYKVLKDINGVTFKRGPVVDGLKAGANIVLTPTAGKSEVDGAVVRGEMTVSALLPGSDQQEGQLALIALDGVREDSTSDIFFLSFPVGKATSFRGRIEIPRELVIASPILDLWFWVLARTPGTLPALPLSYRRLPRPDPACTGVALPTSDVSLTDLDPSACGALAGNSYVEVVSESFVVAAGDEVLFTLGRLASDGYLGDVGVVRMGFRIQGT